MVRWRRSILGTRLSVGDETKDGRVEVEIRSLSAHTVASELAAFGSRVDVPRPAEVRDELARIGAELTQHCGTRR